MREIAERTGVSAVTVSNALRGAGRVSALTRERVLKAAREMNYVPVPAPTRQRHHVATRMLGLEFGGLNFIGDLYFTPMFKGICEEAKKHGYDLMLALRDSPYLHQERAEACYLDRRADGYIFCDPFIAARRWLIQTLVEQDVPVVTRYDLGVPGAAWADLDNRGAMETAVTYLKSRGHKHIAHLAGHKGRGVADARRREFVAVMNQHCLEGVVIESHYKDSSYFALDPQSIEQLIARGITAAICVSHTVALEAWNVALARGMQVPRDLSLIGINDAPQAQERGLTTFDFSMSEIGRGCTQAMMGLLAGQPAAECCHLEPMHFIERASVSAI